MLIPIILDIENYGPKFMLLKYLCFLDKAFQNGWPIVTHEEFDKYELNFPGRNEYKKEMMIKYNYSLHSYEERQQIKHYFVPADFYKELEKEKGSKLEAMISLLNEENHQFEKIMRRIFDDILQSGEEIDGVLYYAACPLSLKIICKELNIPMIAYETGPIRRANYRCDMSYFCREGVYNTREIDKRYSKFLEEYSENTNIPIFSREEILCMFLDHHKLGFLSMIDKTPKYEIGVAGSCALVVPFFAQNKYMDNELINDVFAAYNYKYHEVLIRFHPYDIYTATYRISKVDGSSSPFPFLIQSKRVAAVASNVLLEAMLWKRIPCTKTQNMPANLKCYNDYLADKEVEDVEMFVNFFIFGFMVPMELAYDADYISWRLTNPSEKEIYLFNLNYYLDKFGLNEEWVLLDREVRLNLLKMYRNYVPMTLEQFNSEFIIKNTQNTSSPSNASKANANMNVQYQRLLANYSNLQKEYEITKEWLDNVLNSRSWKLSKPIRGFMDKLRKGKNYENGSNDSNKTQ